MHVSGPDFSNVDCANRFHVYYLYQDWRSNSRITCFLSLQYAVVQNLLVDSYRKYTQCFSLKFVFSFRACRTLKTCQMPQVFSFLNPIALKLGGFIPATDIIFLAVVGDADLVFKEEFCKMK